MNLAEIWNDTIKYAGLIINKPIRYGNPELY